MDRLTLAEVHRALCCLMRLAILSQCGKKPTTGQQPIGSTDLRKADASRCMEIVRRDRERKMRTERETAQASSVRRALRSQSAGIGISSPTDFLSVPTSVQRESRTQSRG